MEARIVVGGDEAEELTSLEDWLWQDPDLRSVQLRREQKAPAPGQMGSLADVLIVTLGSGGAGAALAASLSVWLRTRVSQVSVRIRTARGELEFNAHNSHQTRELLDILVPVMTDDESRPT